MKFLIKRFNRESKFELMRIVAAIFITLDHIPCSENALYLNKRIFDWFYMGGQIGVDLFVIVGAWFLCQSSFKSGRIIRIVEQLVFYVLFLDLISFFLGTILNFKLVLQGFTTYWFPFSYIVTVLLSPFLNKINDSNLLKIIVVGGVFFCLLTMLSMYRPDALIVYIFRRTMIKGPIWFSYCFLFIRYIKDKFKPNIYFFGLLYLVSYIFMYYIYINTENARIRDCNSPLVFVCAFSIFGIIYSLQLNNCKVVNWIASGTFGIYLLQCHNVFKAYVWNIIDLKGLSQTSELFILAVLLEVPIIFVLTLLVDELWNCLYKSKLVEGINQKFSSMIDGLSSKIYR